MKQIHEMVGVFRSFSYKVIAVTGGPCGGKSTFMPMAVDFLRKQGFFVVVVSEAARELIAAGFHPGSPLWKSSLSFQRQVFKLILKKETTMFETLKELQIEERQVVFLCDRGLPDGAAYISSEDLKTLLKEFNVKYAHILDRYDGVINLVSAAKGAEAYYVQDTERFEDVEAARLLEERTVAAWHAHQHLCVIDNSTDFPTKINRALIAFKRMLNMPTAEEIEKKFRVDNFSLGQIPPGTWSFEIHQVYLRRPDKPGIECRLRSKTTDDGTSFYYTEKTSTEVEGVRGEFEEQITKARYDELFRYGDPSCKPITKTRYKIQDGGTIFELDIYYGRYEGLVILEIEFPTHEAMNSFVPPKQFTLIDVTSDKRYSNRMLAEKGIPVPP